MQAYDIRTLLDFFLSRSSDSGHLEPNAFKECFSTLIERNMEGQQGMGIEDTQLNELLGFLFRMFDTDGNGVVDVAEGGRLAAERRLVAAQQHGATRAGEPMLEEGRLKQRVAGVSGRRSRTGTGHEQGTPPPAPLACPSAQPAAARWGAA